MRRPSSSTWYAPMCCVIPRFGLDDGRLANRVEERRLPVVDVTHDRDDRWPVGEILLDVLVRLRLELLFRRVLDRDLPLGLGRDQLYLVVRQRLRGRAHDAEAHEDLDELRHRDPSACERSTHGSAGRDGHRPVERDGRPRLAGDGSFARLPRVGTRTAGGGVDDDAPLATTTAPRPCLGRNGQFGRFPPVSSAICRPV